MRKGMTRVGTSSSFKHDSGKDVNEEKKKVKEGKKALKSIVIITLSASSFANKTTLHHPHHGSGQVVDGDERNADRHKGDKEQRT